MNRRLLTARCVRTVALSTCILAVCSCGSEALSHQNSTPVADEKSEDVSPTTPPQNCLFIILDTMSARRMSLFGYHRETTPFLDEFAKESVVFTHAYSQATITPLSTWSFFTGRYPYLLLGEKRISIRSMKKEEDRLMPSFFGDAGFATAGFSENPYIRKRLGFSRGFDTFSYTPWRSVAHPRLEMRHLRRLDASKTVIQSAVDWMRDMNDQPWFCYVHILRPHYPYTTALPFRNAFLDSAYSNDTSRPVQTALREQKIIKDSKAGSSVPAPEALRFISSLYDDNVAYADKLIQQLIGFLRQEELLEETFVVIAADHGEAFGEHGRILHGWEPYDELIHVPLIVRLPRRMGFPVGPVDSPVELVDLLPTFAEMFDFENVEHLDGISLMALLRDNTNEHHKDATFAYSPRTSTYTVRKDSLKLHAEFDESDDGIKNVHYELYDVSGDPDEKLNLFSSNSDGAELIDILKAYRSGLERRSSVLPERPDDSSDEDLEALGYLNK